jgi:hypothetical protein
MIATPIGRVYSRGIAITGEFSIKTSCRPYKIEEQLTSKNLLLNSLAKFKLKIEAAIL